jgi:hypothetical protein
MRRDESILLGPGPDQGARLGRDERKRLQTKMPKDNANATKRKERKKREDGGQKRSSVSGQRARYRRSLAFHLNSDKLIHLPLLPRPRPPYTPSLPHAGHFPAAQVAITPNHQPYSPYFLGEAPCWSGAEIRRAQEEGWRLRSLRTDLVSS